MSQKNTNHLDIPVRWGDLDAFNHVNNTRFLGYLEECRLHWFRSIKGDWVTEDFGPVVVNINCNFRRPIHWPATIRVTAKATQRSEKTMVMEHNIVDASDNAIHYADAAITIVWVDRKVGTAIPLPAAILQLLDH